MPLRLLWGQLVSLGIFFSWGWMKRRDKAQPHKYISRLYCTTSGNPTTSQSNSHGQAQGQRAGQTLYPPWEQSKWHGHTPNQWSQEVFSPSGHEGKDVTISNSNLINHNPVSSRKPKMCWIAKSDSGHWTSIIIIGYINCFSCKTKHPQISVAHGDTISRL